MSQKSLKKAPRTRSNPPNVGYLGNTHAVVYKRFPGHKCDQKCKEAGHLYIHKFPASKITPLTFSEDRKTLKIKGN